MIHVGDHVIALTHPEWDLTVDSVSEQPDDAGHVWLHCHDQHGAEHYLSGQDAVDSIRLLELAADRAERYARATRGSMDTRDYYRRAAADHRAAGGCVCRRTTGRPCMHEVHALEEIRP